MNEELIHPIIYNIDIRAYFRSKDGKPFDAPVCFAVWDLKDEDLNDQNRFIDSVLIFLQQQKEGKDELLYFEITTRSDEGKPYSEPLWMQKEHTYFFKNWERIGRSQSEVEIIENPYTDSSIFNIYMLVYRSGYRKYLSISEATQAAIKMLKTSNYLDLESLRIFTNNRYSQIIEIGYYSKADDAFYTESLPTVMKLTMEEKIKAVEQNDKVVGWINLYSLPVQTIYGIMLGLLMTVRVIGGRSSIADVHDAADKIRKDYKGRRWFILFSTIIYAYMAYTIFK